MLKICGLEPRVYRRGIELLEPILSGSPLNIGLATPDIPFDASRLLRTLAEIAVSLGLRIFPCEQDLCELRFLATESGQPFVQGKGLRVHAKVIVVASGALGGKPWLPWPDQPPRVQCGVVAVVHQRLCQRLLVVRTQSSQLMNLVPFSGGTTINLGARDRSEDCDSELKDSDCDLIAQSLSACCPTLTFKKLRTHFYVCHKVGYAGAVPQNPRHYFWVPVKPNLFYFYPGKFTLALAAAKRFVTELIKTNEPFAGRATIRKDQRWSLAKSPYHKSATHVLLPSMDRIMQAARIAPNTDSKT